MIDAVYFRAERKEEANSRSVDAFCSVHLLLRKRYMPCSFRTAAPNSFRLLRQFRAFAAFSRPLWSVETSVCDLEIRVVNTNVSATTESNTIIFFSLGW